MTDRIKAGLERLFIDHRIVFWYDSARDMRGEYDAVDLPDVEKVEIGHQTRKRNGPEENSTNYQDLHLIS